MIRRPSTAFKFLLLLVPAACSTASGLGDPGGPLPPLGTIHGAISSISTPKGESPHALRVELAWVTPGPNLSRVVSQDLPVTASFPANFSLALQGPPPAEALWTPANYPATPPHYSVLEHYFPRPGAGQSFAFGQVLVYDDRNGNGKLDMVGEDDTSAPDRIVAANVNAQRTVGYVLYATGGYGQISFKAPDGYGLLLPTDGSYGPGSGPTAWFPVTTALPLGATDVAWNLMMCSNFNPAQESTDLATPGWPLTLGLFDAPIWTSDVPLPPADQPFLTCSPGGTQFCIDACPASGGQFYVCQTYDTGRDSSAASAYCTGRFGGQAQCFTMPDTQPAGWPCTVTPGVDCKPDAKYNKCADADAGTPPPPSSDGGLLGE